MYKSIYLSIYIYISIIYIYILYIYIYIYIYTYYRKYNMTFFCKSVSGLWKQIVKCVARVFENIFTQDIYNKNMPLTRLVARATPAPRRKRVRVASTADLRREKRNRIICRQRPDGFFINWAESEIFILEFTRTFDSDGTRLAQADARK